MMGVSGQAIAAQEFQIIELLPHSLYGLGGVVPVAEEELADHLGAAVALFVEINLAVLHAENAKLGEVVADPDARQNVVHKVRVQRIVRRKTSDVVFWQALLPTGAGPANVGPDFSFLAV